MTVQITKEMEDEANKFCEKIIVEKIKENCYKTDHQKLKKRYMTGILAEMAVLTQIGYSYQDAELDIGDSTAYSHSDLQKIGFFHTGIKCVSAANKYPIIYKQNKENQIICILKDKYVDICGIATIDLLNNCQSDDYIIDPLLRKKGYKTAFTGLSQLIPFSLEKLIELEWDYENE